MKKKKSIKQKREKRINWTERGIEKEKRRLGYTEKREDWSKKLLKREK